MRHLAALVLVLALQLPAEARLGDSLAELKRYCEVPGVHHVRVQLDHGKVVSEAWWLDLEETEGWKLDRIHALRDRIASPRKLIKEWRAGTGIDDNLLADYQDAVRVGVFFEGEGQAQTLAMVSPFFDEAAADGYRDVTIEVAENRLRRPRRAAFEPRLARLATLTGDLAAPVPAGTTAVRLAVPWGRFAGAADPYLLDPAAIARVEGAIARLRRQGLAVVLSYAGDPALEADPEGSGRRFKEIWRQLGKRFGEAGPDLAFEIYDRPAGFATPAAWNDTFEGGLDYLRGESTDAVVLASPPAGGLPAFELPPDDGLLVIAPAADAAARAWALANDARLVALP